MYAGQEDAADRRDVSGQGVYKTQCMEKAEQAGRGEGRSDIAKPDTGGEGPVPEIGKSALEHVAKLQERARSQRRTPRKKGNFQDDSRDDQSASEGSVRSRESSSKITKPTTFLTPLGQSIALQKPMLLTVGSMTQGDEIQRDV